MAGLKDILLHLDSSEASAERLRLAAMLARRHEAHLTGLFVIDLPWPVFAGDGAATAALSAAMRRARETAEVQAAQAEAAFRETLRREGLQGEWRRPEGDTAAVVALHARYADLVVLGQPQPGGAAPMAGLVLGEALFGSGRPLLVVPYAGRFEALGREVLVGWNASAQASRALHDALPLLQAAARISILSVNPERGPDAHGAEPGADIARHLARHGLSVTAEQLVTPEIAEADTLLNRAAELGADLLVLGGYGHSRLRELVLGGVTRRLLREMTVPVLLSH
ncbi:universal stress protein [Pseudoroseomonas cervicalis]|uniref:universal stress protein n=1 Tax=Teichococcus cervicalis TaxID=204525 RepID=UPI002783514B|nr:universal stress protein [Pseudoroseomonas cervicalis]MDQ1079977.1 nucleotide-binding universal stress UspA family protein [Pseudoroseomonas cervicalis]